MAAAMPGAASPPGPCRPRPDVRPRSCDTAKAAAARTSPPGPSSAVAPTSSAWILVPRRMIGERLRPRICRSPAIRRPISPVRRCPDGSTPGKAPAGGPPSPRAQQFPGRGGLPRRALRGLQSWGIVARLLVVAHSQFGQDYVEIGWPGANASRAAPAVAQPMSSICCMGVLPNGGRATDPRSDRKSEHPSENNPGGGLVGLPAIIIFLLLMKTNLC